MHRGYADAVNIHVTVDEDAPLASQPSSCKGLHLYPFQLQSLHRMKSLEANPTVVLDPAAADYALLDEVQSRVGVLANKPGSGKSAVVLSLCSKRCSTKNDIRIEKRNGFSVRVYPQARREPIVEVKASLIVTNPKLLLQWAGYMEYFDYSHFVFTNVSKIPTTLEGMIELCNKHKVIFLSTTSLKTLKKYSSAIRFDRIFFDEIDSMDFPSCTAMEINANFMWWITATPETFMAHYKTVKKESSLQSTIPTNFKEYLQNSTNFQHQVFRDHFVVKCSDEDIDACLALPPYTIEDIIIPKSTALRLTQGIIDNDNFQNLLRGDRIEQAISLLNVGNQTVHTLAEAVTTWMDVIITNLDLEINFVQRKIPTSQEQADEIQEKVQSLRKQINSAEKKRNLLLERITESTDCMICCDALSNPVATKCCAQAFCCECMKTWLSIRKSCPNCRAKLDETTDFIVKHKENAEKVKKDSKKEKTSKKRKASEMVEDPSTDAPTVVPPKTKMEGLLRVLETSNKSLLYTCSVGDSHTDSVSDALIAAGVKVFSVFGLTSTSCMKVLAEFKETTSKACLIVSSIQHSAGFNLQFVDSIIMYQRMGDRETQIIGRGMRPGRITPLKVYRILYDTAE